MNLTEAYPQHPIVATFVDRYQYYEIEAPLSIRSIPNGKIESWFIQAGSCRRWDEATQAFTPKDYFGFHTSSSKTSTFIIDEDLTCINIKWKLTAFSLSMFSAFRHSWEDLNPEQLLGRSLVGRLKNGYYLSNRKLAVDLLDRSLLDVISNHVVDHSYLQLIDGLLDSKIQNINSLAFRMHMSVKTLERKLEGLVGLKPKELSSILRFGRASEFHIDNQQRLTDLISFGFYDQSHYFKECKRLTGYSPTDFFSKLKLPIGDVVFENYENQIQKNEEIKISNTGNRPHNVVLRSEV